MSGMGSAGASAGLELAGAPGVKRVIASSPTGRFATGKPLASPVSTAPSTPQCTFSKDPSRFFCRSISGTSTEPPETVPEHDVEDASRLFFRCISGASTEPAEWDELAERPLPPLTSSDLEELEEKLFEVKGLFRNRFGQDVDDSSAERGTLECEYDADGTPWIKSEGRGPLTLSVLEERLEEVKVLYTGDYGHDVDGESDVHSEYEYDADGTPWVKAAGKGPLTVAVLEERLEEVKGLYRGAYGRDVDDESDGEQHKYDADGTLWIKSEGQGPLTVAVLEERLEEVKGLYRGAYGHDVEDESDGEQLEYDADGTPWIKAQGQGPLSDAEHECDSDGTPWVKAVGQGPLTLALLEERLEEVKALYKGSYCHEVDSESEDEQCEYDADGTPWLKAEGQGPLTVAMLEDRLEEVKALYSRRYGRDVDGRADEEYEYDADGTPWVKAEGQGSLTVAVLEESLEEVKELYEKRYGHSVCGGASEIDDDGTLWTKTVGTGALTVDVLEGLLGEVKELFRAAYGQDTEAEQGDLEYDQEGTPWTKTVGTGPLTVPVLFHKLDEVKELYKVRFGQDVDAESDDEQQCNRDSDGTLWVKVVGQGPLTVDVLEQQLDEVKGLYQEKYSEDVDSDEGVEYDEEGTAWIKTVGTGFLTVEVLEGKLQEVKELYEATFGQGVDESADEEWEYDSDGTPWVKTTGRGPLTAAVLQERLEEVKELYRQKYGQDVDESGGDELEYDEEGTLWIRAVGAGPLTVAELETKLEEVKELYQTAFGEAADGGLQGEECEWEYDSDGTPWLKYTGKRP